MPLYRLSGNRNSDLQKFPLELQAGGHDGNAYLMSEVAELFVSGRCVDVL